MTKRAFDTASSSARIGRRGVLLAALAAPALLRPAWGQSFPTKPVRLVVPFPPAGAADLWRACWASACRPVSGRPW
jgi:hypothetical protein